MNFRVECWQCSAALMYGELEHVGDLVRCILLCRRCMSVTIYDVAHKGVLQAISSGDAKEAEH